MADLHPYQEQIIKTAVDQPKIALWLDLGLGKTIITLSIIKRLRNEIRGALIITPKTAMTTWEDEQKKWEHVSDLHIQLVQGTPEQRKKKLQETADAYIISRDNLAWLFQQEVQADMLVIDESTSLKDRSTQRWASICQKTISIGGKKYKRPRALIDQFRRVILLSGTPASESYAGLWAQIYMLDKGQRLGRTVSKFRRQYMIPQIFNGYPVYTKMKPGATEEINRKLADICISMQADDYIKLPDRIDIIRNTGMHDPQYWTMEKDNVITVDGVDIIAGDTLTKYNKLQQIASGFIYDEYETAHKLNTSKQETFQELLEATDENVLVFYKYQYEKEFLRKLGGIEIDNPDAVHAWQQGKIKLGTIYPASGGRGLNLESGGSIAIWYTLPLSLEEYIQANGRLHRQGQKNTVRIYHLLSPTTIDEHIYKLLQNKKEILQGLLQYFKGGLSC